MHHEIYNILPAGLTRLQLPRAKRSGSSKWASANRILLIAALFLLCLSLIGCTTIPIPAGPIAGPMKQRTFAAGVQSPTPLVESAVPDHAYPTIKNAKYEHVAILSGFGTRPGNMDAAREADRLKIDAANLPGSVASAAGVALDRHYDAQLAAAGTAHRGGSGYVGSNDADAFTGAVRAIMATDTGRAETSIRDRSTDISINTFDQQRADDRIASLEADRASLEADRDTLLQDLGRAQDQNSRLIDAVATLQPVAALPTPAPTTTPSPDPELDLTDGTGFLWKPEGEGDGLMVLLLPPAFVNEEISVRVRVGTDEWTPRFDGYHNPINGFFRAHYRLERPPTFEQWSVTVQRSGKEYSWNGIKANLRYENVDPVVTISP